jgi:nondiscriminating aspartyl-tRNA synthetase
VLVRRIQIIELSRHIGEYVRLAGWLHHQRKLSSMTFLLLRDGSAIAQVVLGSRELIDQAASFHPETVLEIEGRVVASDQAPAGVEIHDPTLRVVAASAGIPPIDLRRRLLNEQLPTQLDHAAISLRHPRRRAAAKVSAAAVAGYRTALDSLGFSEIHTPKLVAQATESGATVFTVDYFGRDAYLAQSPQFFKQTMVGVFERVYEIGSVFRAEPHDTVRHLAEYVSLDAEMGFIDNHLTVMRIAREAVAGMVVGVASRAKDAMALLGTEIADVPAEIPVIDFVDAQHLIESATGEPVVGEPDLAPAHERWIGEWALREHGSDFVFVVGYPMAKRPFYTHPDPGRPGFSNSFDLLFRGLEIMTGGQRLNRYADYLAALAALGESPERYERPYLQAMRYGMPPHGGWGLGLARFVTALIGSSNIREATPFPRDRSRLSP